MEEENTQLCVLCLKSYPEGSEGFWQSYLVQNPYDPEDISEEHDWTCKECLARCLLRGVARSGRLAVLRKSGRGVKYNSSFFSLS